MNNKTQTQQHQRPNPFKRLHELLYTQGLKYVQDGKPEQEKGVNHYEYQQQDNVQRFERHMKRAHANLIAINRLSRLPDEAISAAAKLVFSNLPTSGQHLIELLATLDFSSSRRFMISLGRAAAPGDSGIWDFPDLRISEQPDGMKKEMSGFLNYCNSLYPKNDRENALSEGIQDYRVGATLDATHDAMKRLGLPSSLEQTAEFEKVKSRERKNLRLVRVMDEFKAAVKKKDFGKWVNPSDSALVDGFTAAAEQLWQDFARNETAIFGNLPRLALIVRALQTVAVATTNEFSRASLLDRAPALMRSLSAPSLARSLISMITSQFDALNVPDAQGVLDRLEIALATTPAGGAHAESLAIALPLLMAGEAESLAESGDQDPADIEQEILEGIRFDIGQLIALDLE